ncbi:MAG TPA: VanZ family protein [Humibacter sp.]|nr:VanZ family protein [Humibacter sp.]
MFHRHPILSLFTLAYLGLVGWVTLGPQPFDDGTDGWLFSLLDFFSAHRVTDWITYDRLEFGANVAMFLPIGLFLLLLLGRRRWWLAILLGFALTVGIETAQLYIPGRVSDIRDVISNTTGALVGVVFGLIVTAPKARRLRLRARTAE